MRHTLISLQFSVHDFYIEKNHYTTAYQNKRRVRRQKNIFSISEQLMSKKVGRFSKPFQLGIIGLSSFHFFPKNVLEFSFIYFFVENRNRSGCTDNYLLSGLFNNCIFITTIDGGTSTLL